MDTSKVSKIAHAFYKEYETELLGLLTGCWLFSAMLISLAEESQTTTTIFGLLVVGGGISLWNFADAVTKECDKKK